MGHGEIQPDKAHAPGAFNGRAQMIGVNVEGQVTPIQAQGGQGGVLHGGRGGMADGMSEDRAIARGGVDGVFGLVGHGLIIEQGRREFNLQMVQCRRAVDNAGLAFFRLLFAAGFAPDRASCPIAASTRARSVSTKRWSCSAEGRSVR